MLVPVSPPPLNRAFLSQALPLLTWSTQPVATEGATPSPILLDSEETPLCGE